MQPKVCIETPNLTKTYPKQNTNWIRRTVSEKPHQSVRNSTDPNFESDSLARRKQRTLSWSPARSSSSFTSSRTPWIAKSGGKESTEASILRPSKRSSSIDGSVAAAKQRFETVVETSKPDPTPPRGRPSRPFIPPKPRLEFKNNSIVNQNIDSIILRTRSNESRSQVRQNRNGFIGKSNEQLENCGVLKCDSGDVSWSVDFFFNVLKE